MSEKARRGPSSGPVQLRLFVSGFTGRSRNAIAALHQVCEERLHGRYQLEVIDIYQQPHLARQQQIVATPTLIRVHPTPRKLMIGDLSRLERVLICLGIEA